MQPLQRREAPDFERFRKVLKRQGDRDYVPFFELCIDSRCLEPLSGLKPPCKLDFRPTSPTYEPTFRYFLEWCARVGYDHATINPSGFRGFPGSCIHGHADVTSVERAAAAGALTTDEAFERYAWPAVADVNTDAMERVARLAPEGLGVMTGGPEIFMILSDHVLGLGPLALLLAEDPELLRRIVDRIGEIELGLIELVTSLPFIQGYVLAGDLGYKTGTILAPDTLREYIFPWYKRFVDAAHANGKAILLHSCGNLHRVMDDIVACGFDGKHSFEDAYAPGLYELHARYGQEICLVGGVDVDFLCRADEQAIRRRVREQIDRLGPAGGTILGSGNSIPDYCPVEHYWIMLDEGLRYGR